MPKVTVAVSTALGVLTVVVGAVYAMGAEKVAVTLIAELMVTAHVRLVPEHAPPPQPENVEPPKGAAVSVTSVPLASLSEHVPVTFPPLIAQLIGGIAEEFDVTIPLPEPVSVTCSA